jgi:DNA-binding NarL/FixJ family response regulator
LLQTLPDIQVVDEAGDGRDALRLIELHQPDVVLMDIAMKGLNGLEATARAVKMIPNVRIIFLSMHANEEYVRQALKAGAKGYLLKDSGTAELEVAIKSVAQGDDYLSPEVSKHLVVDYKKRISEEQSPLDQLTPRQREILQLVVEGRTTQQIATTLSIGIKTVETHRAQLMERLGIHDLLGLIRYAIRTGLISPLDLPQ